MGDGKPLDSFPVVVELGGEIGENERWRRRFGERESPYLDERWRWRKWIAGGRETPSPPAWVAVERPAVKVGEEEEDSSPLSASTVEMNLDLIQRLRFDSEIWNSMHSSFNHQGFSLKRVSFGTEMIEVKIEIAADQKSQYNLAPTAEQQTKLNFLPTDSASPSILVLHSGKFDMEQIREATAHWIMMHEHPFTILDEEGFNLMMRWSSTFEMLSGALKFKEVFQIFKGRDQFYGCCPQEEEWNKAQKICSLLEAFWIATHIISDPTKKMFAVEFCFPKLYSKLDASKHISKVKEIINSLYEEYVVEETNKGAPHPSESEGFGSSSVRRSQQSSVYSWDDFDDYCAKVETSEIKRSELVDYLEKGHLKKNEIPKFFSCLEWWRMNRMQYPILSKITANILAIPVSSVASEATFSVGTRVIDSYRSSLFPDIV
ncbi:hypothetical protein ZIOFF_010031 [Zingiber officinale]|uniref:Zinc finger BED domain-containing protein RICESLEEPER 2-like n=1 Tax=Zingiber officinale TaxID=94328 RepID=A0A8J5LY16_ZINOF|nr:hypothetical protein ZIOFF_010031 [Zingiber officinale]